MKSRLFDSTATVFNINIGVGILTEQMTAEITEEINGQYTFTFTYPIFGSLYPYLKEQMIVTAKTPKPSASGTVEQPFRIKRISKPLNGIVEVYCEHISYDLSGIPIPAYATSNHQYLRNFATEFFEQSPLYSSALPFTFSGNSKLDVSRSYANAIPKSMRALLGGTEGSLLDLMNTEYEWDVFNVISNDRRGSDTDYVIRYGSDLIDLLSELDVSEALTHIYPYVSIDTSSVEVYDATKEYAEFDYCSLNGNLYCCISSVEITGHSPTGKETSNSYFAYIGKMNNETNLTTVTVPNGVVAIPNSMINHGNKCATVDFSEELSEIVPTAANLLNVVNEYIASHSLGNYMPSVKIDFVPLWDTDEYKNLPIDVLGIGDGVRVYCPQLIDTLNARIVAYTYDCIKERYSAIELGRISQTAADSILAPSEQGSVISGGTGAKGGTSNQHYANRRSSVEFAEQMANVARTYLRNRQGKDADKNLVWSFEYSQEHNWLSTGFNGQTMKGIDCSSFMGLVLRGIPFEKCPYLLSRELASRVTPTEEEGKEDSGSGGTNTGGTEGQGNYNFDETKANKLDYLWAINPYDYTYPRDVVGSEVGKPSNMSPVRRASQLGNWMHDSGWDIYWDRTFAQVEVGDIVYWAKKNTDGTWRQPDRYMHISHVAICVSKIFVEDYSDTVTYLLGNYAFITTAMLQDAFGKETELPEGLYRCTAETSRGTVENRFSNFEYIGLHRYRHAMVECTGTEGTPSATILNRLLERTAPNDVCLICRPDLGAICPNEYVGSVAEEIPSYTIAGASGTFKDVEHLYRDGFYFLTSDININLPSDLANTGDFRNKGTGLALKVESTYRWNGQKYNITQTLIDTRHTNDIWVRTKYLYRVIDDATNMYLPDDVSWTSWQRLINDSYLSTMLTANGLTKPTMSNGSWTCADGGAKNKMALPSSSVESGKIPVSNGSGDVNWIFDSCFYGTERVQKNTDLNADKYWGDRVRYYLDPEDTEKPIANRPSTQAGLLIVINLGGLGTSYKMQVYIARGQDCNIYCRYKGGDGIKPWKHITMT